MNKNRIRLTESQLHKVIKESVKKILKEEELKGFLLNPSKESFNRNKLETLYDEVNNVCEKLKLPSDSIHQPYIYLFRDALHELITKDSFGEYNISDFEVKKYFREWEYIKNKECFDIYH